MAEERRCPVCSRAITWGRTANGKAQLLDKTARVFAVHLDENGKKQATLTKTALASHWATCSDPKQLQEKLFGKKRLPAIDSDSESDSPSQLEIDVHLRPLDKAEAPTEKGARR